MQNTPQDDQSKSSIINQNPRSINSQQMTGPASASAHTTFTNQSQQVQQQPALKKTQQDSFVVYLSEIGFLKMLTLDHETGFSPLETFLATNHLKRILMRALQSDPNMVL